MFFDPLRRSRALGKLIPVAPLDAVPDDGIPHEFPVVAERVDAWNRSLEPIGAVYLRRKAGEKADRMPYGHLPACRLLRQLTTSKRTHLQMSLPQ